MPKPSKSQARILTALVAAGVAFGSIVYGPVSKALCPHKIRIEAKASWCLTDPQYLAETEKQLKRVEDGTGADDAETLWLASADPEFRKRLGYILKGKFDSEGVIDPDNFAIQSGEIVSLVGRMAADGPVPGWVLDTGIPDEDKLAMLNAALVSQ